LQTLTSFRLVQTTFPFYIPLKKILKKKKKQQQQEEEEEKEKEKERLLLVELIFLIPQENAIDL
jgi:hypothetical protein